MIGATAFDASILQGRSLINVDSEEEGVVLTSCAGGVTGHIEIPFQRNKSQGQEMKLCISGLLGGHSGIEIDKNRENATILLGRILRSLERKVSFSIISMDGGLKDNAIPREACAQILIEDTIVERVNKECKEIVEIFTRELGTREPHLKIEWMYGEVNEYQVLRKEDGAKLLFLLQQIPNGVLTMSADINGLVESSLNLGIFQVTKDTIQGSFSIRSAFDSYKNELGSRLNNLLISLGGSYYENGRYPPS